MKLKTPSRAASTLTVAMLMLVATTIFAQQFSTAVSNDETTTKRVCQLITRFHINRGEIDDAVSEKLLDRFIEVLDPQKLYFLQSDIDQISAYRQELDDLLKMGNVDFAYRTFDLYVNRLNERIELAHKLVDAEHDFSVDESIVIDADDLSWAQSKAESDDRWRKRIKHDLLSLKLDETPDDEAKEQLHKRYRILHRTVNETESSEKLELYLSALAHCFDPHSDYMSPESLEEFQIAMKLSLDGIGAALRSEDGFTVVAEIVPGGAADKDGRLKVGDKIMAVAQETGEFVDIVEMKLSKVVRQIRGKRGTKVRLRVKAEDTGEVNVYALTRQKIELKSDEVKGEIIQAGDRLEGRQSRIGVISIPTFYRDFAGAQNGDNNFKSTSKDVYEVLMSFRDQGGVDVIVIDLRTNGGGALAEAIEVSGLFIEDGPVVQVKEPDGNENDVEVHFDEDSSVAYSGPLVVLCNRLSASASEIFAGVIKDYRRGIVIGDTTTHGKGTVQNVMPVARQPFAFLKTTDLGALKLTINQFYRVNGDSTQNLGIPSDVILPSMIDHMDLGESFLDNALKFSRVRPAGFETVGMVNSDVISELQKRSANRIAANEEFQELQADIDRYLERKNRKQVSLNEQVRKAERIKDKESKDDEEEEEEEEANTSLLDGPVLPDTFYNSEVLAIAADYAELISQARTVQR